MIDEEVCASVERSYNKHSTLNTHAKTKPKNKGTNACVVQRVGDIGKWAPPGVPGDALTAVNTEWGCFGSRLLPRVQEDLDLDAASGPQKGQMLVEKLMSGLYLGECARRVLLTLALRGGLFGAAGA